MKKIVLSDTHTKEIAFSIDGRDQVAHHTWFRGTHCNFNPKLDNMLDAEAVHKHVLKGWLPPRPLIDPQTRIVAFGSCFAENISKWLARRKFNVLTRKDGSWADTYVVRFGEGMVNTFVIRQQFEWAFENRTFDEELWHGYDARSFGYDETVRHHTEAVFRAADVFIITLGLSEIWYDEATGGVFWRAVPQDKYDPSRHKFRVSTVEENRDNLGVIHALIRKHRPNATIIFSLSPIPLVATFRPVSCITANSVSKSILRVAVDDFHRAHDDDQNLFYWPSYEIVMDVFAQRWKADRRHVKQEILDYIMTLFENVWCNGTRSEMTVAEAWIRARAATQTLPPSLVSALEADDAGALAEICERFSRRKRATDLELIRSRAAEIANARPNSRIARWLAGAADAVVDGDEESVARV